MQAGGPGISSGDGGGLRGVGAIGPAVAVGPPIRQSIEPLDDPLPSDPPDLVGLKAPFVNPPFPLRRETSFIRAADYPLSAVPAVPAFPSAANHGTWARFRRQVASGQLPPPAFIRTDELVNAFAYEPGLSTADRPVAVLAEVATCPWEPRHRLVRITVSSPPRAGFSAAGTQRDSAADGVEDLHIRVEFNPTVAGSYRLIGYDAAASVDPVTGAVPFRRALPAGAAITALYEVVPAAQQASAEPTQPLKYQRVSITPTGSTELMSVRVTYHRPEPDIVAATTRPAATETVELAVTDDGRPAEQASDDFRFASAAASLGMLLRQSPERGGISYDSVLRLCESIPTLPASPERTSFVQVVKQAKALARP